MLNRYGFLAGKNLAFEVDNIILREVESTISAKGDNVSGGCTISIRLPELRDAYLFGIDKLSYFSHDGIILEEGCAILFGGERILLSLLIEEIHFRLEF